MGQGRGSRFAALALAACGNADYIHYDASGGPSSLVHGTAIVDHHTEGGVVSVPTDLTYHGFQVAVPREEGASTGAAPSARQMERSSSWASRREPITCTWGAHTS